MVLAGSPVGDAAAREWFVAAGADGTGSATAPFGRIQEALNAAHPGDTVTVAPGTYGESLRTVRAGQPGQPIHLRGTAPRGDVVITVRGRVLSIDHPYFVLEGVVLDGQYAPADTVAVNDGADALIIRDVEIRRTAYDLVDIAAPEGVLIEQCLIHHALNATGGRRDAHGIAAGSVRNLTIRDTEIHTFSGDGVQVDPSRAGPGWDDVTLERVRIWLAPLPQPENGFPTGAVPGENAVDTKAGVLLPRSRLSIIDTTVWGFRGGQIGNMAAFNLKENVEATLDRITVYDSEIAFRLRGATRATGAGAWVAVKNAVVYNVDVAYRYEDAIEKLRIWNNTVGSGVTRVFHAARAGNAAPDVRNLLVLGPRPREAAHLSNLSVGPGAFVDAQAHDYRLAAGGPAIDAGEAIPMVTVDRWGNSRPAGAAYDVGAHEWSPLAKQNSSGRATNEGPVKTAAAVPVRRPRTPGPTAAGRRVRPAALLSAYASCLLGPTPRWAGRVSEPSAPRGLNNE
jgi:hypothetical protein